MSYMKITSTRGQEWGVDNMGNNKKDKKEGIIT